MRGPDLRAWIRLTWELIPHKTCVSGAKRQSSSIVSGNSSKDASLPEANHLNGVAMRYIISARWLSPICLAFIAFLTFFAKQAAGQG